MTDGVQQILRELEAQLLAEKRKNDELADENRHYRHYHELRGDHAAALDGIRCLGLQERVDGLLGETSSLRRDIAELGSQLFAVNERLCAAERERDEARRRVSDLSDELRVASATRQDLMAQLCDASVRQRERLRSSSTQTEEQASSRRRAKRARAADGTGKAGEASLRRALAEEASRIAQLEAERARLASEMQLMQRDASAAVDDNTEHVYVL